MSSKKLFLGNLEHLEINECIKYNFKRNNSDFSHVYKIVHDF